MDNRGQDSQSTDERLKIAVEIDSLLRRPNGREIFKKYTRQAAQQYMAAREKLQLREKRRLEELKKNGVLHSVEELPSPPDGDKSKWLEWVETVRGSWSGTVGAEASTPPNRLAEFHLIKELKFPKDIDGNCEYAFDLHGWIPEELSQQHDPSVDLPLPIPDRMLGLIEKFAGLSALYDAWFLGTEKIAPWGTVDPNKSEVRSGLTHGISEEEAFQASWYYHLVESAKVFEVGEMPFIRTWLTDVQSQLLKGKSETDDSQPLSELRTECGDRNRRLMNKGINRDERLSILTPEFPKLNLDKNKLATIQRTEKNRANNLKAKGNKSKTS